MKWRTSSRRSRRDRAESDADVEAAALESSPSRFTRKPQFGRPRPSDLRPPSSADLSLRRGQPRVITTPKHFAYVKIAEGCDYTCAFCIIPTLRGEYRSRTRASIVAEARSLAERGVKELLLISQDTTFYGIDRQERGALAALLRELNTIDGLEWIRMLYLYPTTITDDVLAAMAECDKVCKYVDLPLQHASADVLKRMRRPGNRQTYDKLLARIRDRVPGVTLRTTFIVGFPGETEDEFAQLEGFVEDTGFDHIGVFTYSHEEGTRAYAVADDVTAADEAEAPRSDHEAAAADRRRPAGVADRDGGQGPDRRPVARARAGPAGPARRSSARNRPGRLSD